MLKECIRIIISIVGGTLSVTGLTPTANRFPASISNLQRVKLYKSEKRDSLYSIDTQSGATRYGFLQSPDEAGVQVAGLDENVSLASVKNSSSEEKEGTSADAIVSVLQNVVSGAESSNEKSLKNDESSLDQDASSPSVSVTNALISAVNPGKGGVEAASTQEIHKANPQTGRSGSAKSQTEQSASAQILSVSQVDDAVAKRSDYAKESNSAGYLYAMAMKDHSANQPRIRGLQDGDVYLHTLHKGFITPELTGVFSDQFLQDIREHKNRLYYKGSSSAADFSLSEIVSFYCSMPKGIKYYEVSDPSGTYLELDKPEFNILYYKVKDADAGWNRYYAYVDSTAKHLNLYSSDYELVNQINEFICLNYDYEVTNSGMPVFLGTGKGQCWHYAKLFSDLCNTVGIPAWKVESKTHAWDQVEVEGTIYTFDPTFNDTSGHWTKYSWRTDYHPSLYARRTNQLPQ